MKYKATEYTYRVFWSQEDKEYVGTVAEFPFLSYLDEDMHKAFDGIIEVVEEAIQLYIEDGDTPPEPLGKKIYSGKLSLRLTPEQHKKAAIEATEAGISINKFIASKI